MTFVDSSICVRLIKIDHKSKKRFDENIACFQPSNFFGSDLTTCDSLSHLHLSRTWSVVIENINIVSCPDITCNKSHFSTRECFHKPPGFVHADNHPKKVQSCQPWNVLPLALWKHHFWRFCLHVLWYIILKNNASMKWVKTKSHHPSAILGTRSCLVGRFPWFGCIYRSPAAHLFTKAKHRPVFVERCWLHSPSYS